MRVEEVCLCLSVMRHAARMKVGAMSAAPLEPTVLSCLRFVRCGCAICEIQQKYYEHLYLPRMVATKIKIQNNKQK